MLRCAPNLHQYKTNNAVWPSLPLLYNAVLLMLLQVVLLLLKVLVAVALTVGKAHPPKAYETLRR